MLFCSLYQIREHVKRYTVTLKAPYLYPPRSFISVRKKMKKVKREGGVGGRQRRGKEREEKRCNYQERSLRDRLHFKEAGSHIAVLHTAPSTSVVRVGKHEQNVRLLIAARSEEVSTSCPPACLLDSQTSPCLEGTGSLSYLV